MERRSTRTLFRFAAALAVLILSTELGTAEDGAQMKMDPKLMEMFSTLQKKAIETSDAIVQNMLKASDTSTNSISADRSPGLEMNMDGAHKFIESLSRFQMKGSGTTGAGTQK